MAANAERPVAVLGASPKPDRMSNRAVAALLEDGFTVFAVNPSCPKVHGLPCLGSLADIRGCVDTLTVYVNPEISSGLEKEFLALKPKRVIFNPGSENPGLEASLRKNGIAVVEACTLVMLSTGRF